jgi:hypothetical protein
MRALLPPGDRGHVDRRRSSRAFFVGWRTHGCPGTAPCTVVMAHDLTVTPEFVRLTYDPSITTGCGLHALPAHWSARPQELLPVRALDRDSAGSAAPRPRGCFAQQFQVTEFLAAAWIWSIASADSSSG